MTEKEYPMNRLVQTLRYVFHLIAPQEHLLQLKFHIYRLQMDRPSAQHNLHSMFDLYFLEWL